MNKNCKFSKKGIGIADKTGKDHWGGNVNQKSLF